MAIDFDALNSKLENTTAALGITGPITICANVFVDGPGEANVGRVLSVDEARNSFNLACGITANELAFVAVHSVTNGKWTFPATDLQWNAVAMSWDGSSTPIARVNFAGVTVTVSAAPSGTFTVPLAGWCVGNQAAQNQTFDGMLAHMQVFNVVLTAREMDQANRRPGSVRRGLQLWLPMYHANYLADLSGNAFNGTGTSLTDRVGGPAANPLLASMMFPSFPTTQIPMEWNVPPALLARRPNRVAASGMRPCQ